MPVSRSVIIRDKALTKRNGELKYLRALVFRLRNQITGLNRTLDAHHWRWCELCEVYYVRCPKCGNNSCNGGYGEIDGVKCDVCPSVHKYQDLAYELGFSPMNDEERT